MPRFFPFTKALLISIIMLSLSTMTGLATTIEVIATVDGVPITSHELNERRNMLVQTTGLTLTAENEAQINRDVLQMLIDDQIKISEGTKLLGNQMQMVEQSADQLIDQTFSQYGGNPDDVLRELNIPRTIIRHKFKADILWSSIINNRFEGQFANARAEAEIERNQLEQNLRAAHQSG